MKRRMVLHLGLSKTGTTSIQAFLRRNPAVLAAHGVNYPHLAGERSSHPALAQSTLRPNAGREVNHEALAMEIRKGGRDINPETPDLRLWSGVFERVDAGNAHTVIISYENFYLRPDLYRFDVLSSHLNSFEVQGIIYLRTQEDWFVSLYGHTIRGRGRATDSFAAFIKARRQYLAYSTMLDEICAHIPLGRLIVADFEQASASGLLPDFFERIGLSRDIAGPTAEQYHVNQSLPHWAILFLLGCNQAAIPNEAFVQVRRGLGNLDPDEIPCLRPGLDLATPEERESLRAAAAADADRLRERYGVTLTERTREPIAYRPFDDEDVEAIRRALAATLPRSAREALDNV